MTVIMIEPSAKLRSFSTRRFTTGFSAYSNQVTAPRMPTAARQAKVVMKPEVNQSSSSPRSTTTCKQPRPSAISPRPM